MKQTWSFSVIEKASDYVMQEYTQPTEGGHRLSFVGERFEADTERTERARDTALTQLHEQLGFRAISQSDLKRPQIVSYHDKIGYFFKLLIPSDTDIDSLEVHNPPESRLVVKSFDAILDALAEQELLELSSGYAERYLQ